MAFSRKIKPKSLTSGHVARASRRFLATGAVSTSTTFHSPSATFTTLSTTCETALPKPALSEMTIHSRASMSLGMAIWATRTYTSTFPSGGTIRKSRSSLSRTYTSGYRRRAAV